MYIQQKYRGNRFASVVLFIERATTPVLPLRYASGTLRSDGRCQERRYYIL